MQNKKALDFWLMIRLKNFKKSPWDLENSDHKFLKCIFWHILKW